MKFIASEYWDIGKRAVNEDSVLIAQVDTTVGQIIMGAVADGIGGLSEGQVASGYVLEEMNRCFHDEIIELIVKHKSTSRIIRCLTHCLYEINCDLRKYADSKSISLGSTLSLILIFGRKYIFVHLGDSGIIRCAKNTVEMITKKHITGSGGVNKCIGSFSYIKPDIECGKINGNMGFLLASDGFYKDMKYDNEFWDPSTMKNSKIIDKRLGMMGEIVAKKQTDNASAVYICCY